MGLLLIGLFSIIPQGSAESIARCAEMLAELTASQPICGEQEQEQDAQQCEETITAPSLMDICPVQVDALLQHPWSLGLARETEDLVFADLTGLQPLYQWYSALDAVSVVDVNAVDGILRALDLPAAEAPSWWQQLWRTLQDWLHKEDTQLPSWFDNISISEFAVKTVMYGSIALVLLMALGIVGAEVRLGLANRRRADTVKWDEKQSEPAIALDFEQLSRAPLRMQPGLLLDLILALLRASDVLQLRRSCTHRDVTAATANLEQGEALGQISAAAEHATFGNWCPAPQEMQQLLETGRHACDAFTGSAR